MICLLLGQIFVNLKKIPEVILFSIETQEFCNALKNSFKIPRDPRNAQPGYYGQNNRIKVRFRSFIYLVFY